MAKTKTAHLWLVKGLPGAARQMQGLQSAMQALKSLHDMYSVSWPYAEASIAWVTGELRKKDEVAVVAISPTGLCKCRTGACIL